MGKMINSLADRLLARVVKPVSASAACQFYDTRYCYCSGGIAYRRICQVCYNSDGSTTYICGACTASGTC
jgi:hypothetical protein